MRLAEALGEEERKEILVVLRPVVTVVLCPSLVFVVLRVEIEARTLGAVRSDPDGRADIDDLLDAIGMISRELGAPQGSTGLGDDDGGGGIGGVHHRKS